MKLVCDACGSKYSISDDRVAGKVFKIRCKKCSQVIVVRGALPIEAAAPEPAPASSGEWHVVIDGQQSGPFEREELLRRQAAGELDDESFVWRDGMEEWAALGTLAELRGESTRVEAGADLFSSRAADAPAHELFATSAPDAPAQALLAASAPASPSSGRATGRAAMTSSAFAGSAVVATDDTKRLLAERNENSVLFTLGNLAKLASPAPTKASNASPAGTEGSGLIDIRALASTFASPSAKAATAVGSIEDLPVYAPATFGEPIVLMPHASRGPDRKLMYMLLAAIAVLAIVATVLVVVVMRGSDSTETGGGQLASNGTGDVAGDATSNGAGNSSGHGTAGNPPSNGTANSSAATTTGTTTNGTTATTSTTANGTTATTSSTGTPTTSSTAATASSTSATTHPTTNTRPATSTTSTRPATSTATTRPTTSTTTTRPTASTSTSTTSTRPTTSSTTSASTTRPTTSPTTATATTRPTAPDRVQCEFSNYADKGCEVFRPATSNTGASNLPDNLDRAAIAAGLGTIRAQACGGRSSVRGDVSVTIKVNADGGVSGVTIKSSPDPVLSSCVTAAAGKGTFAKTKRGASFGYVWRF